MPNFNAGQSILGVARVFFLRAKFKIIFIKGLKSEIYMEQEIFLGKIFFVCGHF